jgi:GNAT superfamily N-acetyltransferase
MHISFLQPTHLESTVDLLHEMSVHYNGKAASTREAVQANLVDNILGPHSDVHLVVAYEASRVVGLAAISILYPAPKERGQLFMKELYVASDCREAGIGQELMRWIARYAVSMGCIRFDWTVDAGNLKAISFYRELGAIHLTEKLYFRLSGVELADFAGPGDAS